MTARPPCFEVGRTVLAQYANSPAMLRLIHAFEMSVSGCGFFDDFYDRVWNPETATGFGLDIWGRIVGVSRSIAAADHSYFGFSEETGLLARPFNNADGMFYNGHSDGSTITFDDESYRRLIFLKAAANISDNTISALNRLLRDMFPGRGDVYVRDGRNMTAVVVFCFRPELVDISILQNAGIFPKPAGVFLDFEVKAS